MLIQEGRYRTRNGYMVDVIATPHPFPPHEICFSVKYGKMRYDYTDEGICYIGNYWGGPNLYPELDIVDGNGIWSRVAGWIVRKKNRVQLIYRHIKKCPSFSDPKCVRINSICR